jgi:hypothetical protein
MVVTSGDGIYDSLHFIITRSHLKNRTLVQDQGGAEFQPADILQYFEDLKRGPNAEIGPKVIFTIASNGPWVW